MTLPQILSCSLVAAMMAAFVWGKLRYDVIALLALLAGVALGVVPTKEAFSGFSDDIEDWQLARAERHTSTGLRSAEMEALDRLQLPGRGLAGGFGQLDAAAHQLFGAGAVDSPA